MLHNDRLELYREIARCYRLEAALQRVQARLCQPASELGRRVTQRTGDMAAAVESLKGPVPNSVGNAHTRVATPGRILRFSTRLKPFQSLKWSIIKKER
jgi:hypothetical protein